MNRFLDKASRIFEAAEAVAGAGTPPSDMTILIGTAGGIRLVANPTSAVRCAPQLFSVCSKAVGSPEQDGGLLFSPWRLPGFLSAS
jgi:hypothetical protein